MKLLAAIPLAMAVASSLGCAATEPKQADVTPTFTGQTSFPPDIGRYAPRVESELAMIYVPVEVNRACIGQDPRFAFDSTRVTRQDRRTVESLSLCMKQGPLAGRRILLVGRADSRGSAFYNERLGLARAAAVKLALMKTGIPSDRIAIATLGKDDAVVPPKAWDRRVDVQLLD
jgi:outer membrane protein OmpA-like peptidoglycan-associated protein